MAELDLPTGNTGGEQHLAKFLATLTQLVDVLGKTGPGGDGGEGESSSPAASKPDNSGKALVGATRKLFNDVANAFRPLKSVLASFSKLQATPQPAGNMALPAPTAPPESPAAAPAPAPESTSIHDAKYDRFFKPDQFTAFRKTDAPAPTAPPVPGAPAMPESGTGPRVIQVQDASVGIEQATVKMNGGTAAAPKAARPGAGASAFRATTPKARPMTGGGFSGGFFHRASKMRQQAPASPASPSKAFSPTAARFTIANGLFEGRLMLPPAIVFKAAVVNLHAAQVVQPAQAPQSPIRKPQELTRKAKAFQTTAPKARPMTGGGFSGGFSHQASGFRKMATPKVMGGAAKSMAGGAARAAAGGVARSAAGAALGGAAGIATGGLAVAGMLAAKAAEPIIKGVTAPFKIVGDTAMGVGKTLAGAFTDPIGTFKKLTSTMIGFVQAVNPAAVMGFNFAMRDLNAVIGKSMIKALTMATEVVREFADILAPIMRSLTGTIDELASSMRGMFMGMIRLGGMVVNLLMPIFKSVAVVFGMFFDIVTAITEGLTVFLGGFMGIGEGMDKGIKVVTDAIVDFTKWIVRATLSIVAVLAKLVGATGFLDNMRKVAGNKGAGERENTTGIAAPTGGNFTAAESFGKSIATASFTATSAATAPKKTDDFLDQIAKDMDTIANVDLKQLVIEAIESSAPAIARAIAGGAKETLKAAGNAAYEWNPLKGAGEWLGDKAAGLMGY